MQAKVYKPQGADQLVVAAGGSITIESGGSLRVDDGASNSISEATPVGALAAALTTTLGVADAELVFTAAIRGAAGDAVLIEYVDPEDEDCALEIAVDGSLISVSLETDGTGAVVTTATDIITELTADPAASQIVNVAKADNNDGSGVVIAMEATPLAGGRNATVAQKGDMFFDATNIYIAIDDVGITDDGSNWRKVVHAAL